MTTINPLGNKRGRKAKPYKTTDGRTIDGLYKCPDGRWRINETGAKFTCHDERLAISKFMTMTSKGKGERHTKGLRDAIAAATAERDEAQTTLEALQGQLDKIEGRQPGGKGKAKSERLTGAAREAAIGNAIAFVGGSKDGEGVSRSAVAEHLGVSPSTAANVLKELVVGRKIGTNGKAKAGSRYPPA